MWKQKLGMSIGNGYKIPTCEIIHILKTIGFDAISPCWSSTEDLTKIVATAKECGLSIQSMHAPFGKAAGMWSTDPAVCEASKKELFDALDGCIQFEIPIMVVHTWIGFDYEFHADELYYGNFDELVTSAKAHHIKIAFENTEGEEYLSSLMTHYQGNDTVGFCWDSGHELCYNHSQDLLAQYGDRLIMTHLNDNLGISRFDGKTYHLDDLHLLPYDGIADWDDNIRRLKKAQPLDILNFELSTVSKPHRHENDLYSQMSYEEYFTEAYKRACKIAYRYIG